MSQHVEFFHSLTQYLDFSDHLGDEERILYFAFLIAQYLIHEQILIRGT